jgi:ribonuclease HIII
MKSILLDAAEAKALGHLLRKHAIGEIAVKSEHEEYRFDDKRKGILVIGYKTGKIVYKDGDVLKELIGETVKKEEGYDYYLGTDEAGKGEWYGPLVVFCVALAPGDIPRLRYMGVTDSKKLSRKSLEKIAKELLRSDIISESTMLTPDLYNRRYEEFRRQGKTLNDMMAHAHCSLIKNVLAKLRYRKAKIVIDMFDYKKTEEGLRDIERERHLVVQKSRAESEIPVAAASILAKYAFEKEVDRLNLEYAIDLRKAKPSDIPEKVLPKVAKLHFRNVSAV